MTHDYRTILKGLYDEFGEDAIRLVRTRLVGQVHDGPSRPVYDGEILDRDEDLGDDRPDQSTHQNADHFEQRHLSRMREGLVAAGTAADVFDAFRVLVEGAVEVAKFEEAQVTLRTDIAARRDIALARIENQKTVLLAYLDKSFDERKENFRKLFSLVDHALESSNMEELGLGLESIIRLAESSPFRDLSSIDATAVALGDPDHEWDF